MNNKSLMKVFSLFLVVALLAAALPLQAKAQTSSPNPTFLTVDMTTYNDEGYIAPSEEISIKWERNPIMGAKSGRDVIHVEAPVATIDYAAVGIPVNIKLTEDTEISYWGYTKSVGELAPDEIYLVFENGEVIANTDPQGEVGEWFEWTLSDSDAWFDPMDLSLVDIEDYYNQMVIGVALGVGAPQSGGNIVDVYLDNLKIDADGDGTNEYVLDDDTGTIEVLFNIQEGIDAALPGDTLNIWPAGFVENLTIDKPLTLKAAALQPQIEPLDSTQPLITITSQDVNLVGLTLWYGYTPSEASVAVLVDTEGLLTPDSLTSTTHWNIEYCSFVNFGTNIMNLTDFKVMAEHNWWGSITGPKPGSIIGDVDYTPWLRFPGFKWAPVEGEEVVIPQIEENKDAGTLVGTFEVIHNYYGEELDLDPDEVYTLEFVNSDLFPDNELFRIEGFELKLDAKLNYEDPEHDRYYFINVRVTDTWDNSWEGLFWIEVTDVNEAPVLTLPEDLATEINEDEDFSFLAEAEDEDVGDVLTFSLVGAPVGATINPSTGLFSWTPSEEQGPETYSFIVKVCDDVLPKLCDEQAVTLTVKEINEAPVANLDAYYVLKGTKLVVPAPGVLGNDTDADLPAGLPENTLSVEVVVPPVGGELDLSPTGSFEFAPPADAEAGSSFSFTYRVSDGKGKSDDAQVTLTIKGSNTIPTGITVLPAAEWENVEYVGTLTVNDDDPDGPSLQHTYSFVEGSGGEDNVKFDIVGNQLIAKAPFDFEDQEEYHVRISATDFFGQSTVGPLTITVWDANDAPVLTEIGDKVIDEGRNLTFSASARDEDLPVQTLVFSLEDGDEGEVPVDAVITPTGTFSWTPLETQGPGEYTFDVCVWDGGAVGVGLSDCETITVMVNEVNEEPEWVDFPDFTIPEEAQWIQGFSIWASDPDVPVQTLSFSLAGDVPAGANISKEGVLTWKPTEEQGVPGPYSFDVCVSDGVVTDPVCETITIIVDEVNSAPVAKPDFYAVKGNRLEVPGKGVLANDSDKDIPVNILTVSQVGNLAGLTLYPDGHFVYNKPVDLPAETEFVTFTYKVTDNGTPSLSSDDTIVTLLLKSSPPVGINLAPSEIAENKKFVGVLTTGDPNGVHDVHTYTFVNTCEGGALDNDKFEIGKDIWSNDVLIAKEPFDFETRNSYSVCVRTTDLFGLSVDKQLDIRVIDVNEAPEAVSQEVTTIGNKPIEITLEGIDPEGDELTYAIFSEPKHGTLEATEVLGINFAGNGVLRVIENTVTYTPGPDFEDGDSFTFKVMDAKGLVSNLATVTIKVEAAPTQQFIFLPIIVK